jgi:quinol monooxygenase YgiN
MIAVITKMRVKHFYMLPQFFRHAIPSATAAHKAAGVHQVSTKAIGWHTHCTLTVWESEAAMRAFVTSKPHIEAMRAAGKMTASSSFAHWETDHIPDWQEAFERLAAHIAQKV